MSDDSLKLQPFDYKTLTFIEWLNAIDENELFDGKPDWLKILIAARADILASYIDARANDNMFHSMFTKQNVFNFASYLDYSPNTAQCATGEVSVTLVDGTSLPVTIPKKELIFKTAGAVGDAPVTFSALADHTFNSMTESIPVREGEEISEELTHLTTGAEFEEIDIERTNIVKGLVALTIDSYDWTEVSHFFDSSDTDKHFRVIYNYEGMTKLRCGNGVYGEKYPIGQYPVLTAWYGGGTRGNVPEDKVTIYEGGSSYVASCNNTSRMSGGRAEESMTKIKTLAPMFVQAQDRVVSKTDFWAHSVGYSGIERAYVQPNYYGVLSTRIQVVPSGGGDATSVVRNALQVYLKAKSVLSNIFIQVDPADYQEVDVDIEIKVTEGYEYANVSPFMDLGIRFVISELTPELKESLESAGIAGTVTYINSLWGFTFDNSNDVTCRQIKNMLKNAIVLDWGGDVYSNRFYAIAEYIDGIDEIVVNTPSSIDSISKDKLATVGAITLSQSDIPERDVEETLSLNTVASTEVIYTVENSETLSVGSSCYSEVE